MASLSASTSSSSARGSFTAELSTAARVAAVRDELQQGNVSAARVHFQCLPDVTTHRFQWVDHVLGDIFSSGFIDMATAIGFLDELPDLITALHGCLVLYRTKTALEKESTREIVLPTLNLARLVYQLKSELAGRAKSQAETYWNTWFGPTTHAIVTGKPVVLESSGRRETLYAASANFAYDVDRRNVFGWRQQWTSKLVHKEQWKLVAVDATWDKFHLQSIAYGENLYVEERHQLGKTLGVFLCRNAENKDASHGGPAQWQLVSVVGRPLDEYAIYNSHTHMYLSLDGDPYDDERRFLTITTQPFFWRVRPQRMTPIEKGVARFYAKQYGEAALQLSLALERVDDMAFTEKLSCYAYRLACNARLARHERNALQEDYDAIQRLGGVNAVLMSGVYDRWKEGAVALGHPLPVNDETQISAIRMSVLQDHLDRGGRCLVEKQYDRALAAFSEVTTVRISLYDSHRQALKRIAQLDTAKCRLAMGNPKEALALLDKMLKDDADWYHATPMSMVMEARVWLLISRCRRVLKQYDEAIAALHQAVNTFVSMPVSKEKESDPATIKVTGAESVASLQQWLLLELRLVAVSQRAYLDRLLARDRDKKLTSQLDLPHDNQSEHPQLEAESEAEGILNLFQCPLSLELMREPVVAPSGMTYEREMIECHLDTVGPWDPLTRRPLEKSQLHPNRALTALMATMLSEHRLGKLLSAVNE